MKPLVLPPSSQRVVALSALKRRAVHRHWVCSTLWPYAKPRNAVASLRSALWRLRPLGADSLLVVEQYSVALAPGVSVDWHDAMDLLEQVIDEVRPSDPQTVSDLIALLHAGELLEGWTDRWCSYDRGRYHARRLTALNQLGPCVPTTETQVAHYARAYPPVGHSVDSVPTNTEEPSES